MTDPTLWVIREPGGPSGPCPWLRLCAPEKPPPSTCVLGAGPQVPDRVVVFPSRESARDWCPPGWLLGRGTGGVVIEPTIEPAPADLQDRFPIVTLRDAHSTLLAATMPDYGRTARAWALMPIGPYDQQCRCTDCRRSPTPRTFRYVTAHHRALVFPTEAMARWATERGWLAGKPLRVVEWDGDDCGTGLRPIDARAHFGGTIAGPDEVAAAGLPAAKTS